MEKDHPVCKACYMKNYAMVSKIEYRNAALLLNWGLHKQYGITECAQCVGKVTLEMECVTIISYHIQNVIVM